MRIVLLCCAGCIVGMHCEISSRDCIVLHRGIALCNMRIPSCSIVQIPSCAFYGADSVLRILSCSGMLIVSCAFHRAHCILLHRADSMVGSHFGIACGLYRADCIVRIASCGLDHGTALCNLYRIARSHHASCVVGLHRAD